MKTYDITRETKRFVYMEIVIETCEEHFLADIIDERLHCVKSGQFSRYRGYVPTHVAKDMITAMNASPYSAGYSCYIDGQEERRMVLRA